MTIALDRTTSHPLPTRGATASHDLRLSTPSSPRTDRGGRPSPAPAHARALPSGENGVTITVSVTLPSGTGDVEAALLADNLRAQATRLTSARRGLTTVTVTSPRPFVAAPQREGAASHSSAGRDQPAAPAPHRHRPPTSPARRDAENARRRAFAATAVSPSSPSAPGDSALVLDLYGRRVRIDGQDVDLTYKEFELLAHLARNARRTVSREELMTTVWSDAPAETGERTVDVHVRRLRTKLGRYRKLVSTVRGTGYRLDPGSDVAILG
ncbi:winged helix-turn-helix domain-containing protein [Brachybacterium epidermidis]|uniref:winged helix-turn-helix domain-containing protein n=1 Tax=Brachybacterium epidermidis TaxID=2781983 RepID=UPI001D14F812|nr:winged helix-turn-helix domain-containing protein [Brachybacterium epidermidis]